MRGEGSGGKQTPFQGEQMVFPGLAAAEGCEEHSWVLGASPSSSEVPAPP